MARQTSATEGLACRHGSATAACCFYRGYDSNGNLTSGYNFAKDRPRTLSWTSFNQPRTITENGQSVTLHYGANHARFRQINGFTGETTLYVDGLYELQTDGTYDTHVHYIRAGARTVAIYKSESSGAEETLYVHRDHLGSVSELSDATGLASNVERLAYDAWGKRRNADWTDGAPSGAGDDTARGYTAHEHLDDVDIVHMNGRLYDADVGRMLSADPYLQFGGYSQSHNRYGYVLNNPLAFTDPSGYCIRQGPACPVGGLGGGVYGGGGPARGSNVRFVTVILGFFYWLPSVPPGQGFGGFGSCGGGTYGLCHGGGAYDSPVVQSFGRSIPALGFFVFQFNMVIYSATGAGPAETTQGLVTALHAAMFFLNPIGSTSAALGFGQPGREPAVPNEGPGWARTGASIGVGAIPVAGTVQSVVEVFSGRDYIEGTEVNRWLAGAGIVAGVVPRGKAALKGGAKAIGRFFGRVPADYLGDPGEMRWAKRGSEA